MNGADRLCDTLLAHDVNVCFANPGTSEMHFVAALDRKPQMRCILGLSEGVVAGAADGYARMADKPAATLLHLGPGLGNALANLHNARRAHTPMINVVGDHATYHLHLDAPLTSDIESIARPMSNWVGRIKRPGQVEGQTVAAWQAAMMQPGISTLILAADAAWGELPEGQVKKTALPPRRQADAGDIRRAVEILRGKRRTAIILTGRALRADMLDVAGRIAHATGARLLSQGSNGRIERGAGRISARRVPYPIDQAIAFLADLEAVILIGATEPVGFFAYPGKPGHLLPQDCEVLELAGIGDDLPHTLHWLADELGAKAAAPLPAYKPLDRPASGKLTVENINQALAASIPENAIVCDEMITSGRQFFGLTEQAAPHDFLALTGGAIGIGIPLATGAAIACPDRKVIGLQADGSGMYTLQALWTQARENLDVVTVIFANASYAILQGEMRAVGVNDFGTNARRMLTLDEPVLDWTLMARGMGVEAARAETLEDFNSLFDAALRRRGPFLIEARI